MIDALKQANQGRKILRDWVGESGTPVPLHEAQSRANICAACPHNYAGSWTWRLAVSVAIGLQMRLRDTLGIKLANEDKLRICELCGCKLQLKVHVPFRHLYRHTADEQFMKYPPHCWQRKEFEAYKSCSSRPT